MTKILKCAFVSMTLLMGAGCSVAQDKPAMKTSKPQAPASKPVHGHKPYSKPTAAIYFSHDFSGTGNLGEMQAFNLKVTDNYPGASINLRILPSEGISYFGPAEMTRGSTAISEVRTTTAEIDEVSGHNMALQFQPKTEGIHKLTVVATANLADGQSIVRSYSIPIHVGEAYQPTKQSLKEQALGHSKPPVVSGGVIIMEAQETIED